MQIQRTARRATRPVLVLIHTAVLVIGVMLVMSPAARADGSIGWGGQGAENVPCTSGAHWVLAPAFGIESATLIVDGVSYAMAQSGEGSWSADSGPVTDLSTASVSYTGDGDERDHLQLSHCTETETTPPPTSPPPTSPPPTDPPTTPPTTTPTTPPTTPPTPTETPAPPWSPTWTPHPTVNWTPAPAIAAAPHNTAFTGADVTQPFGAFLIFSDAGLIALSTARRRLRRNNR